MRLALFMLLLLARSAFAQCTNVWAFPLAGAANGVLADTNNLRTGAVGTGGYQWVSYRGGVTSAGSNDAKFATAAKPTTEMSFGVCSVVANRLTHTNVVGLSCPLQTNYNWRLVPDWAPTSGVLAAWMKWNGAEIQGLYNLDVLTMYPTTSTNFVNADLISNDGAWRIGFENPGGSDQSAITGLHSNTWYKVVVARNIFGTNYLQIYNINTQLVGSVTSLANITVHTTVANACIGCNSIAATTGGVETVDYYGAYVDLRDNPQWPIPPDEPVPPAPTLTVTRLPALAADNGVLACTWSALAATSGYLIERSTIGGGAGFSVFTNLGPASQVGATNYGLTVGTQYFYRASATNDFYSTTSSEANDFAYWVFRLLAGRWRGQRL